MRFSRTLLMLAAAAMLAGCGDRNLIVNVDVLSYLDPSVTQIPVGPIPAFGGGGVYTGEVAVVEDEEVNLIDGTNSIADVQNVSIRMTVVSACETGSGSDTLRVYMAGPGQDPVVFGAVVMVPLEFAAGVTDTVVVETAGDSRVADLFTSQSMRITMTNSLRGPQFGDMLNGSVALTALDVTLVAGRKNL